ncbi:hypothetical protein, partial [Escherichia coli]|uniref:hypothetical protein n=1 Tax=Escherichia coli TaxID=562 RepID=UPI003EDFF19F
TITVVWIVPPCHILISKMLTGDTVEIVDVDIDVVAVVLPVITRDTQRQAAAQRFNEAEHYGNYDDFREFSRHQPLTQQQKD